VKFFNKLLAGAGLLSIAFVFSVQAQTPPDAGVLRQQIESQLPPLLPADEKPRFAPPQEYQAGPGLVITVKQFRFAGNTLLTAEQLAPAVEAYINRSLDFAGLQGVAAAVSEAYRSAGWLVRAYLPRQEISDGVVTLHIVESIFGQVRLEGAQPSRRRAGA